MKCPICGQRTYNPKTVLGARVRLEPVAVIRGRWIVRDGVARFSGSGDHVGYLLHKCPQPSRTVQMFE